MTALPIRIFGDPVLRTPADVVNVFDKELRRLVADLTDTMLAAPGSGLAAPQIGVALRVFTYHVSEEEQGHLINPTLHFPDELTQDGLEGCLSIPGLSFDCIRRENVVAHGQNMYGDPITVEGTARLARAIQHETDHLDGVLFVDRLDRETRKEAMRAIREAEWAGQPSWLPALPAPSAPPVIKVSPH
ncbi:MAG: def [Pseudonocardiales bacterium]|nr:def [Pseudonocardiales bacterium]